MLERRRRLPGLPLSNQSKGEEMAKAMNAVVMMLWQSVTTGDFGYDQLKKLEVC